MIYKTIKIYCCKNIISLKDNTIKYNTIKNEIIQGLFGMHKPRRSQSDLENIIS